jgi:hypothetical protein
MNSNLAVVQNRDVAALSGPVVPALVAASGTDATMRFLDFFATQIENDNTRAAYLRGAREFLAWCDGQKIGLLTNIRSDQTGGGGVAEKASHTAAPASVYSEETGGCGHMYEAGTRWQPAAMLSEGTASDFMAFSFDHLHDADLRSPA